MNCYKLLPSKLGAKHYKKVKLINNKLIKLQNLFIEGKLDKKEYLQAKKRYTDILNELEQLEHNQNKQQDI